MQRACDSCGDRYEAKRPNSRFCSDTCRQRNQRAPKASVMPDAPPVRGSALVAVTVRELAAAGRLDTVLGQQAVRLAEKMGALMDTGSATAAVSRELRAVMAEALKVSTAVADPLDEFTARRERKAASA